VGSRGLPSGKSRGAEWEVEWPRVAFRNRELEVIYVTHHRSDDGLIGEDRTHGLDVRNLCRHKFGHRGQAYRTTRPTRRREPAKAPLQRKSERGFSPSHEDPRPEGRTLECGGTPSCSREIPPSKPQKLRNERTPSRDGGGDIARRTEHHGGVVAPA